MWDNNELSIFLLLVWETKLVIFVSNLFIIHKSFMPMPRYGKISTGNQRFHMMSVLANGSKIEVYILICRMGYDRS